MRKLNLFLIGLCISLQLMAKPQIQRVEPLSWWTEMNCPLTLMMQGQDLENSEVTIQKLNGKKAVASDGLVVTGQHNAESPNYLFINVDVREAGTYRITLTKNKKKASWDYVIAERQEGSKWRQSFTSADVIYLIMPDRFVDGNEANNSTANTREKADKNNINGRFGGDIAGIVSQLDHIQSIGATTIWPTPLLLDDEANWSYHGYACSDYYHIDPRYGSNEEYKAMVETAHQKGLKIVMDMVPNHCGAAHWWMQGLPYKNWINRYPEFTRTNGAFSTNYDPNASEYDKKLNNGGWFDLPMPDMNLQNPDLLQYFKQWAIWWIEYANLDGLRVDTYPYIARDPAADWCKQIVDEYPNINIVGECWTRPTSAVAYWQHNAGNKDGFDSNMPSVMDFPLEEAMRQALENDGKGWGNGLTKIYDVLSQDYLYGNVNNLLLFLSNHDMARFADIVKDQSAARTKLALTMLATMRGIPQLLYGEEYNLHASKWEERNNHSYLRCPLPLNNLTDEMQGMQAYLTRLLQWRKKQPVIHTGKTMHFHSMDNTYAYFRYNNQEAVFVFINASEEVRTIPTDHYNEILSKYHTVGVDVITGNEYDLSEEGITVEPLSSIVVKLSK